MGTSLKQAEQETEAAIRPFFHAAEDALSTNHILAARQFTPERLAPLFEATDELRENARNISARRDLAAKYAGRQLCSLFYEPSTRTRLSFETAAAKLGMGVVSTENAREFSSAAKGESIEDTVQVLREYDFDAIVLRHHETGAAARAAAVSNVPIVNAGDGKGEHPTQALLDAYTIHENHGQLSGLKIVMGGDLKHGRTVRSLAQVMSNYAGNHLVFATAPEFQMEDDIKQLITEKGITYEETTDLQAAFADADVVYWTRLQKERLDATHSDEDVARILGKYTITQESLKTMPERAIIMHPLPRVNEIQEEVDHDPRAVYFRQAGNGLYVRMALLDSILKSD